MTGIFLNVTLQSRLYGASLAIQTRPGVDGIYGSCNRSFLVSCSCCHRSGMGWARAGTRGMGRSRIYGSRYKEWRQC